MTHDGFDVRWLDDAHPGAAPPDELNRTTCGPHPTLIGHPHRERNRVT